MERTWRRREEGISLSFSLPIIWTTSLTRCSFSAIHRAGCSWQGESGGRESCLRCSFISFFYFLYIQPTITPLEQEAHKCSRRGWGGRVNINYRAPLPPSFCIITLSSSPFQNKTSKSPFLVSFKFYLLPGSLFLFSYYSSAVVSLFHIINHIDVAPDRPDQLRWSRSHDDPRIKFYNNNIKISIRARIRNILHLRPSIQLCQDLSLSFFRLTRTNEKNIVPSINKLPRKRKKELANHARKQEHR